MGMLMDPTLGRVIERWRAGDRDAFEEVMDRYGLQLLRTARLILRDPTLAEDAVQETFLKAWQRIGSLRDEDPGPWLTRIAMNESISLYRRRHRFQALIKRFGRLGGSKHEVSSEARLDLAQALDRLTAEQRAAVALHYYQDLSVEDAARALKVPVDTMKSRLKTALRRLREVTGAEEAVAGGTTSRRTCATTSTAKRRKRGSSRAGSAAGSGTASRLGPAHGWCRSWRWPARWSWLRLPCLRSVTRRSSSTMCRPRSRESSRRRRLRQHRSHLPALIGREERPAPHRNSRPFGRRRMTAMTASCSNSVVRFPHTTCLGRTPPPSCETPAGNL